MLPRALALGLAILAAPAVAAAAQPPGDIIVDSRLRHESVDQDGFPESAVALTLRTRLGYETPAWQGFKVLAEAENVTALDRGYNSTTNGKVRHPVVGDPEVTQLNRAQVSWSGGKADAVVGRQRIVLGNARFVGNAGFRQTEQTFNAAKLSLRPTKDAVLTYVYIDGVHRVFGRKSPQGEWDSDSHVAQADLTTALGQFSAYGHLLAFPDMPAQSSASWGGRFSGARPLGAGLALTYEAEAARQNGHRNSPTDFDLGYLGVGVGLRAPAHWATVSVERLDGDGRRGFQTPLATLFAYQGWADVFLSTPAGGVRDLGLNAGANLKFGPKKLPVRLQVAAHDFADDDGSRRFGRELDLLAAVTFNKSISAEFRAAIFDGARPEFADRNKIWLSLEAKY